MESQLLIVMMVDGWRARSSGAYGNTWYPTPAFDRIASQGTVFDRYLGTSSELAEVYDTLWTGRPAPAMAGSEAAPSLLQELSDLGSLTHLVTDDPQLASSPAAASFDQQTLIESPAPEPAGAVFDTAMGRVMEAAADVLGEWSAQYEQPRMLWVHLRGFYAAWDAPAELAARLVDEEDPPLEPGVEVPAFEFDDADEVVDRVFQASCRYAGQVMALDRCLGGLDDLLAELSPDAPPSLVLGGTRGFALGEHGAVGTSGGPYGEQFHLPLVLRGPGVASLQRHGGLVQPADLAAMLAQLAAGEPMTTPDRQVAHGQAGDGTRFVQTHQWHFVARHQECELYVKPDDLWEANDVATLCPEEVDRHWQLAGRPGAA